MTPSLAMLLWNLLLALVKVAAWLCLMWWSVRLLWFWFGAGKACPCCGTRRPA